MSIVGMQLAEARENGRIRERVVSSEAYAQAVQMRDWDTCDLLLDEAFAEAKRRRRYGPFNDGSQIVSDL